MIKLRKEICPICDESWIHPFLIKNNIPITFIFGLKWTEVSEIQSVGIKHNLHFNLVDIEGKQYKRADIYKYIVLKSIPELQESWKKAFPNYDFDYFKISVEELLKIIKK